MELSAKKIIAGLTIAAAAAAGLYLFILSGEEKGNTVPPPAAARRVKYMTIAQKESGGERIFPGRIVASQKVNLSFRVSGQIIDLPSVKGVFVEKGTLLAKLDPRDFVVQLANAKSDLGNADAQISAMKAGARKEEIAMFSAKVESARAQMNDAMTTMERVEKLYKAGGFSRAEYDKAITSYRVARSAYQSAAQEQTKARAGARPEDISAMEFTISGIEGSVKTAQNALKDTELRAPFSGVIIDRYVDNNQSVQKDQAIVSLQDIQSLEVSISVSERIVALANRENLSSISARFRALPEKRFPLIYKEASASADPQTQTYPITFSLEKPEEINVLPGMTVDVIATGLDVSIASALEIPSEAVFAEESENHFVWKIIGADELRVTAVPVKILGFRGSMAELDGALAPGDRIVTAGASFLLEDDPVTLYEGPGDSGEKR
ncbi:efflux RND transporter periplasmic adaptor subunit [Aminivibrio sp.]|uniref:efflux RND transporter periplasmic adaptor subunit n=1 Tax=Aminivibrio sp. TaxID=1872489 RepID=UPI001A3DA654|nr:efflux RND transporter periplasmic adaptor subunit [Aminivibrio sp.]MBL3538305.1 efflux RND transporter periplasmic adaptor subunit [Aminivibrio sp.]